MPTATLTLCTRPRTQTESISLRIWELAASSRQSWLGGRVRRAKDEGWGELRIPRRLASLVANTPSFATRFARRSVADQSSSTNTPRGIAAGDFDGDGFNDILYGTDTWNRVYYVPNQHVFSCPAGKYLDTSSGSGVCAFCEAGSYKPGTGIECQSCEEGKVSALEGATSCTTCAQGFYSQSGSSR